MVNPVGKKLISQPITYGLYMVEDLEVERAIRFLENPNNVNKLIPPDLLSDDELEWVKEHGRLECAKRMRQALKGE